MGHVETSLETRQPLVLSSGLLPRRLPRACVHAAFFTVSIARNEDVFGSGGHLWTCHDTRLTRKQAIRSILSHSATKMGVLHQTVIHSTCFSLIITSKKQLHPERREGNLKPKARLSLAPSSFLLAA